MAHSGRCRVRRRRRPGRRSSRRDRRRHRDVTNKLRGTGFAVLGVQVDAAALAAATATLAAALAPESVRAILIGSDTSDASVSVVPDADGGIVAALGARDGEVFVIRPDGLLLCRIDGVGRIEDVARHLSLGDAPTGASATVDSGPAIDPAELRRENVWMGLSDALDQVGENDREGFLARLALVLGSQVGQREFEEAIAAAADPSLTVPADRNADATIGG
ncbi:hypothetical protein GS421_05675 [Rhodococcus hoagii]|nr:hypothetical protein [Prescottella equi]